MGPDRAWSDASSHCDPQQSANGLPYLGTDCTAHGTDFSTDVGPDSACSDSTPDIGSECDANSPSHLGSYGDADRANFSTNLGTDSVWSDSTPDLCSNQSANRFPYLGSYKDAYIADTGPAPRSGTWHHRSGAERARDSAWDDQTSFYVLPDGMRGHGMLLLWVLLVVPVLPEAAMRV